MSEIEQDLILFFKLYLLAHKNNYINYMEHAKTLAQWFDFSKAKSIQPDQCDVYCGSCYNQVGRTIGGGLTMTCSACKDGHNWAYEINRLCDITRLPFFLCMYLLCRAIEELYIANNAIVFQHIV